MSSLLPILYHPLFVGLIGMAACFVWGQLIADRALSTLSTEQKGRVVEIVAPVGRMYFVIALLILVPSAAVDMTANRYQGIGGLIAIPSFLALMVMTGILNYTRLKKYNFPQTFLRSIWTSRLLSGMGIILFIAALCVQCRG